MENLYQWIEQFTGLSANITGKLLKSIFLILGFIIINKIISQIVSSRTEDVYYR